MMLGPLPLLLLALTSAPATPAPAFSSDDGLPQVVVPQKRAALVLDRLLIALQKALREDPAREPEGPRVAPLRIAGLSEGDMMAGASDGELSVLGLPEPYLAGPHLGVPRLAPLRGPAIADDTSSLQRRGQGAGRGRVLRCYFNAVTCF